MDSVGSYQAKTHLPALLERVEKGEQITITRHGVPVAVLMPVQAAPALERRQAIAALKEFGRSRRLPDELSIRKLIEEGRRF